MKRVCTSTIAIACALISVGCSRHASPASSPSGVAQAATLPIATASPATPVAPAAPATPNYALPNGKPDYVALRRDFGAPNTNLEMNPKAVDVWKTDSRNTVVIESNKLIFSGPHNAWLSLLNDSYTLYCSHDCGGEEGGFVRNIRSIRHLGKRWVVATEEGSIQDVVRRGWLHAEVPLLDRRTHKHPHYEYKNTFNLTNMSKTTSVPFSAGAISGTATATATFNSSVAIDIVVVNPITNGLSNTLQTFSSILTATPGFTVTFDATATGGASWDADVFPAQSFPLGAFSIGPVPVVMTLVVNAKAHADVNAQANLHYNAQGSLTGTLGFTYTSSNGLQDASGFSDSFSQSATVAGSVTANAYVEVDADIQALVFKVAGPDLKIAGQLGIEASASAKAGFDSSKSTCSCQYDVQGDIYFQLTGSVGLTLTIPHIKTFKAGPKDIASHKWILVQYQVGGTQPDGSHDKKRHDCQVSGADAGADGGACTPAGTASTDGTCDDCCVPGSCDSNQICSAAGGSADGGGSDGGGGMCTPSGTASVDGTCDDCCTPGSCDASQICTDGPDAGAASNCPDGQQDCGDGQGCHDLSADPANCASCGNSCATNTGSATSTCSGGTCNCICPDGMTQCPDGMNSSSCTTTTTCPQAGQLDCDGTGQCATDGTSDPNNCGACGTVCGGGSICAGGLTCVSSQCICADGVTACSDPSCANCPTGTGQQNANCAQGQLDCDGSGQCATDGTSDPNNCGGCSNQNPSFSCANSTGSTTSTCNNSVCQCLCSDGMTACPDGMNASSCTNQCASGTADCSGDGSCDTDLTSDASNCNACGQACQSGFCVSSQCACDASGTPACPDGTCGNPDTNSDPTHCGASCVDCTQQTGSSTSTCNSGSCQCLCSDGQTACPDGQNASSCTQGTTCPDGQQDCNGDGNCEDLTSDPNNCNGCGNVCNPSFCVNSACACDANGTAPCGDGSCPDLTSDAQNCGSCGNDCTQNLGPNATCDSSNCSCDCTCGDGSACPSCDQSQCGSYGGIKRPRH